MAKKKIVKAVGKKKIWVEILAPKLFNEQSIGETNVFEAKQAVGKGISVNMASLTGSHKKQTITISFNITGLREGKAITEIRGYKLANSSVKRMMRRGKAKIEDSFVCFTSDKVKIRVKPIVVTRTRANNSTLTSIRKALRNMISSAASKLTYAKMMEEVINYRIQKGMFESAKKVFPVSVCEIRWIHLVPVKAHEKKEASVEEAVEEPKEEKPKKEASEKEEATGAPKEEKKESLKAEAKPTEEVKEEVSESAEASN